MIDYEIYSLNIKVKGAKIIVIIVFIWEKAKKEREREREGKRVACVKNKMMTREATIIE